MTVVERIQRSIGRIQRAYEKAQDENHRAIQAVKEAIYAQAFASNMRTFVRQNGDKLSDGAREYMLESVQSAYDFWSDEGKGAGRAALDTDEKMTDLKLERDEKIRLRDKAIARAKVRA